MGSEQVACHGLDRLTYNSMIGLTLTRKEIMKVTDVKISDLVFAEYNPRQMTIEQVKALTDSIKRFGIVDPIIINSHKGRENIIIGGHQRVRVATNLGMKEIPCTYLNLPLDKERELNIRLNQNLGEWDWDALSDYFSLDELEEWGFDERELEFEFMTREPLNLPDDLPDSELLGKVDGMGQWLVIRFEALADYKEMLDYLQLEDGTRTVHFQELRPHLDEF